MLIAFENDGEPVKLMLFFARSPPQCVDYVGMARGSGKFYITAILAVLKSIQDTESVPSDHNPIPARAICDAYRIPDSCLHLCSDLAPWSEKA